MSATNAFFPRTSGQLPANLFNPMPGLKAGVIAGEQPDEPVEADEPPAKRRLSDISLGNAFTAIAGGLTNTVIDGVGIPVSTLVNTPKALYVSYKSLYETPWVGRNLKVLLGGAGIPVAAVLTPVLALLGGAGYGLGSGFMNGIDGKTYPETVRNGVKAVQEWHAYADEVLDALYNVAQEPLPEGKKPYDVSVLGCLEALAAGTAAAPIMAIGLSLIAWYRIPTRLPDIISKVWKQDPEAPIKNVTITLGLLGLAPIAAAFAPVAGLFLGFSSGLADGYTKGFKAAMRGTFYALQEWWEFTAKKKPSPQPPEEQLSA